MENFSLPENLAVLAVEDIQELIEAAREEFHTLNDSDSLEDETLDRMTELADAIDNLHDEFINKVELAISKRDDISSRVFASFPGAAAPFKKKGAKADEGSQAEEDSESDEEANSEDEGSEEDKAKEKGKGKKPFPGAAKPFASETVELEAETEEFNLSHLKSALTNINDTISALQSDPPNVGSALSNAKSVKTEIEDAIAAYGGAIGVRVVRIGHPGPGPSGGDHGGGGGMSMSSVTDEFAGDMPEYPSDSPDAPKPSDNKKGVTKGEADGDYPASDYAYVPDPDHPSTWKLRLTSTPGGDPDSRIVGAAVAALGKGFRGNKVAIPAGDLPKVKAKVKAAWLKANPDRTEDDLPSILR